MTIDIRPMIEDVSQVMTKHITSILSGVIGEYTIYKETHDTIMGLPCVRRLQERISELEQDGSGCASASMSASSMTTNTGGSREEEVAQLQSAIADLNRYIHALESKVDMKSVSSGDGGHNQHHHHQHDEESVRLEIYETDDGDEGGEDHCESNVETSSTHKNVIITTEALEDAEDADAEADAEEADAEADAEEEEEEEQEQEDADAEAEEAEEADAEEADAEDAEEAEAEEAEAEEAEEAEAEEAEQEEAEDAEADAEAADAEAAEAEEETEEVEEVKIKGKTYFTTDPQNGIIYACVDDDVGDEVGVFKNGVAVFNKGKK
jgi:hypothetical protein